MTKTQTIALVATVCPEDHGGPNNSATVYGHSYPHRNCLRLGETNTWIYDPRRKP